MGFRCALKNPTEVGTPKRGNSPIIANRFNRAAAERFLASGELGFTFGLFADVRIGVLEISGEVFGCGVAADITVDAGRVDVEGAVDVLFNFVVWVRHESVRLRRFRGLDKRSRGWNRLFACPDDNL